MSRFFSRKSESHKVEKNWYNENAVNENTTKMQSKLKFFAAKTEKIINIYRVSHEIMKIIKIPPPQKKA